MDGSGATRDHSGLVNRHAEKVNLLTFLTQRKCRVLKDVTDFFASHDDADVNASDEEGHTALMFACRHGCQDLVEFLLEGGADPNKRCHANKSSLHFACQHHEDIGDNCSIPESTSYISNGTTLKIVKTLLERGAEVDIKSRIGWSPVCYAALFCLHDVVDYFIWNSQFSVTVADRIYALEVLACMATVRKKDDDAFRALLFAMALRLENNYPVSGHVSGLGSFLNRSEARKVAELHAIQHDQEALLVQACLVGERVLPEVIKHGYFWQMLIEKNGTECHHWETFLQICTYLVKLEAEGKMKVGTVLYGLAEFSFAASRVNRTHDAHSKLLSLYNSYQDVLPQIDPACLCASDWGIANSLGTILGTVICLSGPSQHHIFQRYFHVIVGVARCLRDCLTEHSIRSRGQIFQRMLQLVCNEYVQYFINPDDKRLSAADFEYMKQAASVLLQHEGANDCDVYSSMLLDLTRLMDPQFTTGVEDTIPVILPLARILVRQGCPVERRNSDGWTAYDLASRWKRHLRSPKPKRLFKELLKLLNEPTTVVPLQELAAQAVLRNKIPYHGRFPVTLCTVLDSGDSL